MSKYKVLLGGLGDDAHSIGITLIKLALEENGFVVSFLGIQNTIQDFIKYSKEHDIIMVSCINGHSELYLNNDDLNLRTLKHRGNKLWYVGGNLSVDKSDDYIVRLYREKGFSNVFPKPISIEELLFNIRRDIEKFHVFPEYSESQKLNYRQLDNNNVVEQADDFDNREQFEFIRKKILTSWFTGREVNYLATVENHKGTVNMDWVLWNAKQKKKAPIVQPRTGVAEINKQYQLLDTLRKIDIGVASIQLDAASRRLYFDKALEGVEKSIGNEVSVLNGYPVPVHGVQGVHKLSHIPRLPFQIRGGAPDHRFVYEVGICGGSSSVEGGFLCYLLPYEKKISLKACVQNWKYIDFLCGIYHKEYGITINREFFGPLTTTLIEPSIPIVINIVESISAASYGVKSLSVGLAEQGNRSQDIAAIQVLDKLTNRYLKKYGYNNVHVTTVFHQYMGAFPQDELKAEQLIEESSITAALSKVTRIMTKTPVEAIKIPDVIDNSRGIILTHRGIKKAKDCKINYVGIEFEKKLIESEVVSIMNCIEFMQGASIEEKAIHAVLQGIIDVPFSPSIYNRGDSVGFRNIKGAIRFAKVQNMPFEEWVKEIHQNDLYQRMTYERDNKIYSIMEKDITRIGKCEYKQWPLGE